MRSTGTGTALIVLIVCAAAMALSPGLRAGPSPASDSSSLPEAATDPESSLRLALVSGPAAGRMTLRIESEGARPRAALRLVALPPGAEAVEIELADGGGGGLSVTAGRPMVLRGLTVLPLVIESEASAKTATSRSAELEIRFAHGAAGVSSATRVGSAEFYAPYLDLFPPEQQDALRATGDGEGGYLIITAPELAAAIEPLATWKREMGYPVTVVTTTETGPRNDQIQAYIRTLYQTAPVPPEYVLLVGDLERVAAFDYHGSISDHGYSLADGDDFLPDLEVGRLSAIGTMDLGTIVAKILNYEQTPERTDPSWFARALLVAGNYSSSTPVPVMRWVRAELLDIGYAQVDSVYYPPHWGTGPTLIRPLIDRGVSLVAYRGWAYGWQGWEPPKFTVEHIPSLANGWRLPVVMSFVCLNGDFTEPECFGEAWIRAGTAADPKGAVAFIGNSEHWSHTRFNDAAAIGAFRAIADRGERRLGGILNAAKFEILTQFPDILEFAEHGEESVEFYFHIYSLLGDPGLAVWTAAPESVLVAHASAMPAGASLIETTVRKLDGSTPVAGARVGVSQNGNRVGSAFTDAGGVARVFATIERSDVPVRVTVTGAGVLPYRADVPVTTGGPYLAFVGATIRDDGTGGSQGNGDGLANPNELLSLEIEVENRSAQPAPAGTATLAALAGAGVETATAVVPALAAGATGTIAPFAVRIDPEAEDALQARFRLHVLAGSDSSVSGFELQVRSPALRHLGHTIGGDQVLSPGDTAAVTVTLQNDGAAPATAAATVLRSLTPALATVRDSMVTFPTIAPGEAVTAPVPFVVVADPAAAMGQTANFALVATTAEGYVNRTAFSIRLGPVDHRAPLGPDAYGYYAVDNTDTDYPDVTPVYEWVTCSPVYGGSGTRLDLHDNTTVTVALPFSFTYYGRSYQHLLVSDNGWAAFDTTTYYDYYNWSMPNPYGAGAQLAPFWDNLDPDKMYEGNPVGDGVYVYHDSGRGRFVVEWSRLGNFFSQHPNHNDYDDLQTFQLILFDPVAYPTPTGDGLIRFQYKQVYNNDVDRMYSTVGIENDAEDIGIEYSYSNLYPDRAAPLSAGLAVDFTTAVPRYVPFRLDSFAAAPSPGGVLVAWQPVDERPRLGYRVYREEANGKRSLVPGGELGGGGREFLDRAADPAAAALYWIGALDPVGHETLLGPYAYSGAAAPRELALAAAGANPFSGPVRLTIAMPAGGRASLRVYSVTGRLVCTLSDGVRAAGTETLEWDGRDDAGRQLPSGVYLGRLVAGGEARELKLVLLR